jgi:hypothetical protein
MLKKAEKYCITPILSIIFNFQFEIHDTSHIIFHERRMQAVHGWYCSLSYDHSAKEAYQRPVEYLVGDTVEGDIYQECCERHRCMECLAVGVTKVSTVAATLK